MTRRIAVIGGGAAGTLTAVHLLRAVPAAGVEVVLIDRQGDFGPGVAYGTTDPLHLLNVPAVRMGAISGQPEHFHSWLCERDPETPEAAFVARGTFGEYLRELLEEAQAGSRGRLTRLRGEVVAVDEFGAPEGPLRIALRGGDTLPADAAVLALGPLSAAAPAPISERLADSEAYIADPWAPAALDPAFGNESVLIIGTGLTMVDVAISLGRGERGPRLRAISRNGLIPRRHREQLTEVRPFGVPLEGGELQPIVAAVLEQIARVAASGGDWRDVFDSMRSAAPTIWRSLSVAEKRRFLAGLQRFWDVHRFRMAPRVADRFDSLCSSGRLSIEAATILALEPAPGGGRVEVTVQPADGGPVETFGTDRVINCSGAGTDVIADPPPLLAALFERGIARPDELGLGLEVAPNGALVGAPGRPEAPINVVGCLRKGVEWEAIGITEIRDHAAAAAQRLLATPLVAAVPAPSPARLGGRVSEAAA